MRTYSADRMTRMAPPSHVALRHGAEREARQESPSLVQDNSAIGHVRHSQEREPVDLGRANLVNRPDLNEMPLKRRFPS